MSNNKNTTAIKEQLTYALVWQFFIITLSVLTLFFYIIPKWNTISEKTEITNESIRSYEQTYKKWLDTKQILALTAKDAKKKELNSLVKNNMQAVKEVITKSGPQKQYLQWLNEEFKNSEEDRRKLKIINAKISSIIPTLSPVGNIVDEKRVSLKDYIVFIENKLLTEHNIKSSSPISIDKITYAKNASTSPMGNIGFVDINLQFEGTNDAIYKFLDSIYTIGNTEILTQTGNITSIEDIPGVMSNPLITIESLTLNNEIDIDNDKSKSTMNAGTVILRFYIRGSSEADAIFLANEVKTRKQALKNTITDIASLCEKEKIPCNKQTKEKLIAFNAKYNEFLRMATDKKIEKSVNTSVISGLAEQIQTLQNFNTDFKNLFQSLIDAKESLKTK